MYDTVYLENLSDSEARHEINVRVTWTFANTLILIYITGNLIAGINSFIRGIRLVELNKSETSEHVLRF